MRRYGKIVLEAEKGITFELSERTSGELNIRIFDLFLKLPTVLAGEYAEVLSVYTDNDGNKAIVPPGWTVSGVSEENIICGKNKGMVIYQIQKEKVNDINWSSEKEVESLQRTYDQFVWIPVESLDSNGTLDGVSFTEKFGRRNYWNNEFSEKRFHETLTDTLVRDTLVSQLESVEKYGGFYISRYKISKNLAGKPQSVKGVMPWVKINFDNANKVASTIEKNKAVKSHLPLGAEYDSVLEWFIKSNARTYSEIVKDYCGNYCNSPRKVAETGSREEGCINNIYGFASNVEELTQEQYYCSCCVVRGGYDCIEGGNKPFAYRTFTNRSEYNPFNAYSKLSFRATLCIR